MECLRTFLNRLSRDEQIAFAVRCGTTVGYLRKAISAGQRLGDSLVIAIERESAGAVTCEELRPDVDWAYLRGTARRELHGPVDAGIAEEPPCATAAPAPVGHYDRRAAERREEERRDDERRADERREHERRDHERRKGDA